MDSSETSPGTTASPCRELSYEVEKRESGLRLDRFLADRLRFLGISREKVKTLIRQARVLVDDIVQTSPKAPLPGGSRVHVSVQTPPSRLTAESGDISLVYRDAVLAVVNKPAGLTVHPAPSCPSGTLAHRLLAHFPELARQEGFRPGIVHRLDKDTSGLLLAALTEQCRLALSSMFAARAVHKEYLALARGVPEQDHGFIDAPIGRDPRHKTRMAVLPQGKPAQSAWRVLYADAQGRFSLMAVRIFTGRTHQVRVHMRHIGHPLWGDKLYGAVFGGANPATAKNGLPQADTAPRQMLHAWKLALNHPLPEKAGLSGPLAETTPLSFVCPPPPDFSGTARRLAESTLRVAITGSPGCGKSALTELLRVKGLPVFSADAEIARQYRPGGDGHNLLRSHFGNRFAPDAAAPVDKSALGEAMARDTALRREVEALLHPLVWHALEEFWREQDAAGAAVAVAEIPLYLESGRTGAKKERAEKTGRTASKQGGAEAGAFPPLLLVGAHCPFAVREQRLLHARGWTKETIAVMESWQWPEEKKMRACDIVIDNTGSKEDLARGADELFRRLLRERDERTGRILHRLERLWNPAEARA